MHNIYLFPGLYADDFGDFSMNNDHVLSEFVRERSFHHSLFHARMSENNARILVIEDHRDISDLLKLALNAEGYQVTQAFDGIAGQAAFTEQRPDLVLLDAMIPGMDGFKLCRQARDNPLSRTMPILLMSAKTDLADKMAGFRAGADDYIVKPFAMGEVLARVATHLRLHSLIRNMTVMEQKCRQFMENTSDAVLALAADRLVLFHNGQLPQFLQHSIAQDWTGVHLSELMSVSSLFEAVERLVSQVEQRSMTLRSEVHLLRGDRQTVLLEMVVSPILNNVPRIEMYQCILRDITGQNSLKEVLKL